jgi:hypothetical protein
VDFDASCCACLAVPSRQLGSSLDHFSRRRKSLCSTDYDVATRDATCNVEPEVGLFRNSKGELIVLDGSATNEDLPTVHLDGTVWPSLTAHRQVLCPGSIHLATTDSLGTVAGGPITAREPTDATAMGLVFR